MIYFFFGADFALLDFFFMYAASAGGTTPFFGLLIAFSESFQQRLDQAQDVSLLAAIDDVPVPVHADQRDGRALLRLGWCHSREQRERAW